MKIKKTTPLVLTGVLLASVLGTSLYAQGQHNAKTHATGKTMSPQMGMMGNKTMGGGKMMSGGMMSHHNMMTAKMKTADAKLNTLVTKMNAARGNAKIDAMAGVINEMVAQRKTMHSSMQAMHQSMMGKPSTTSKSAAKPKASLKPDEHQQHH